MSLLRRFAGTEQVKVLGSLDANVSDSGEAVPEDVAPSHAVEASSFADDSVATAPPIPHKEKEGLLHALATDRKRDRHRTVTDTLLLLKSLSPVLRAALLYPGPDATPQQYGEAVSHMSAAAASLADVIARDGDPLELDGRWARKVLQELASELVAHHWVATVISRGGVAGFQDVDLPVEMFAAAIHQVVQLPVNMSGRKESFDLSYEGSIRLSFLKAFAPLAVDIEKYGQVVNGRLEAQVVDIESLQSTLGQYLMDQALLAQEMLLGEGDYTDDDRRMTLQACLAHVGAALMAVWEPTRGDALGTLADSPSIDDGRHAMTGLAFTYGFPVESFRTRVADAVQRLVGTTQAAMLMVRKPGDPSQRRSS